MHRRFFVFLILLSFNGSLPADWINLTGAETAPNIAEIKVLDDRVRLALEIYIGDLETFEPLIPDDWIGDSPVVRPSLQERMAQFAADTFQVVSDSGEQLAAELLLAEPRLRKDRKSPFAGMINPYTRQRVLEAPADKRVLYAEIDFPFRTKPQSLTFIPPRDEQDRARVTVGFIVYHKSVPVIDFRYLSLPARLNLNWEDPWYSRFDNPNLKRHHKSALMSFLYVEPYEVRHEILTRVKDLQQWMDLELRDDRYIEAEELQPLKQRIGEFLLSKNPLRVDGRALKPILDRNDYVQVSLTGIQLLEQPERLEVATAIVGVIIAYITEGMPQQVTVDWELFTDQIQRVPATDPAGPLPTFLTAEDNIHTWTNFLNEYQLPVVRQQAVSNTLKSLHIPVLSLLCAIGLLPAGWWLISRLRQGRPLWVPATAVLLLVSTGAAAYPLYRVAVDRPQAMAGELTDEQAAALLQALLKNVYRAFEFREEGDVYDKLALTVGGDLLPEIYL